MEEVFKSWFKPLAGILNTDYFKRLVSLLDTQYELSHFVFNKVKIYPDKKNVFKCFRTDFNDLKVVFIGDSPFDESSEGLAYDSSYEVTRLHPISELIRYTIENEFHDGFNLSYDFSLEYLMNQGVLLLNESLTTTNQSEHKSLWREFIVHVISVIQERHTGIIFCMKKTSTLVDIIDVKNQYILLFDDPADYTYNPVQWNFKFKTINDIIEQNNGKENIIKF